MDEKMPGQLTYEQWWADERANRRQRRPWGALLPDEQAKWAEQEQREGPPSSVPSPSTA